MRKIFGQAGALVRSGSMKRSTLSPLWLAGLVAGCVSSKPISAGLTCPCAAGWSCDTLQNVCWPNGDGGATRAPIADDGAAVPEIVPDAVPPDTTLPMSMLDAAPGAVARTIHNPTPDPVPAKGWPAASGAMVYDGARKRVVMFPGSVFMMGDQSVTRFPVWEWDGATWQDRTSATASTWAPPLEDARAAYDSDRQVTVIFGGVMSMSLAPSQYSQETWEWNGSGFTKRQASRMPPGRHLHATIYDPVHKVTLVFSGWPGTEGGWKADLWQWDGNTWTDLTPAVLPAAWPAPRSNANFVWDSVRQRALLFGGMTDPPGGGDSVSNADLWEWDGSTWTNLTPATLGVDWPLKRNGAAAGYDPVRGVMLLFGGRVSDRRAPGLESANDLWEWDSRARAFREITPMPAPGSWPLSGDLFTGAFDLARDRFVFMDADPFGEMNRWVYEFGP
jgi:hypothetical protein